MSAAVAVIVLNQAGLDLAIRLQALEPTSAIHALASLNAPSATAIEGPVTEHLRNLYAAGTSIVGICAAGILIRALAPLLADKHDEPPVIVLAADGSSAVPLLGGHRGANAMALRLATFLGGHAAITTASDVLTGLALDDPPDGWRVGEPERLRPLLARVRNGEKLVIEDGGFDAAWLDPVRADDAAGADLRLSVHRVSDDGVAVLHPQALALGVGTDRGCPPERLWTLVRQTLDAANLAPEAIACVVSIDKKAGEPAVLELASSLGVPVRFFDPESLEGLTPRLKTPSNVVFREVGAHGVCEAAALAAVGPEGRLLVAKTKEPRATCAVALAPRPLNPATIGRPAGRLLLLSLGPGERGMRTRAVDGALRECTDLVGFSLYLDQIEPEARGQRHPFPLGEEVDRCRHALNLAADGGTVGLVGSGDVGVYAMAAPLFELAASGEDARWATLPIDVYPGVSAMHLAAARLGAPLGHDFAAISLSDLMTPWPVIAERLDAAAKGDFVVALYNPVSKRRIVGFERAVETFRAHRPADTPCLIARQLGRPDERLAVTMLADLKAADVDMLTLVLIGSSQTQKWEDGFGRARLITPRGYKVSGESAA